MQRGHRPLHFRKDAMCPTHSLPYLKNGTVIPHLSQPQQNCSFIYFVENFSKSNFSGKRFSVNIPG